MESPHLYFFRFDIPLPPDGSPWTCIGANGDLTVIGGQRGALLIGRSQTAAGPFELCGRVDLPTDAAVAKAALSSDGEALAVGTADGQVLVVLHPCDPSSWQLVQPIHYTMSGQDGGDGTTTTTTRLHHITAMCWSRDHCRLYVGDDRGVVVEIALAHIMTLSSRRRSDAALCAAQLLVNGECGGVTGLDVAPTSADPSLDGLDAFFAQEDGTAHSDDAPAVASAASGGFASCSAGQASRAPLLVSGESRNGVYQWEGGVGLTHIGSKPHQGQHAACWRTPRQQHPPHAPTHTEDADGSSPKTAHSILSARPGGRLWVADSHGLVLTTLRFTHPTAPPPSLHLLQSVSSSRLVSFAPLSPSVLLCNVDRIAVEHEWTAAGSAVDAKYDARWHVLWMLAADGTLSLIAMRESRAALVGALVEGVTQAFGSVVSSPASSPSVGGREPTGEGLKSGGGTVRLAEWAKEVIGRVVDEVASEAFRDECGLPTDKTAMTDGSRDRLLSTIEMLVPVLRLLTSPDRPPSLPSVESLPQSSALLTTLRTWETLLHASDPTFTLPAPLTNFPRAAMADDRGGEADDADGGVPSCVVFESRWACVAEAGQLPGNKPDIYRQVFEEGLVDVLAKGQVGPPTSFPFVTSRLHQPYPAAPSDPFMSSMLTKRARNASPPSHALPRRKKPRHGPKEKPAVAPVSPPVGEVAAPSLAPPPICPPPLLRCDQPLSVDLASSHQTLSALAKWLLDAKTFWSSAGYREALEALHVMVASPSVKIEADTLVEQTKEGSREISRGADQSSGLTIAWTLASHLRSAIQERGGEVRRYLTMVGRGGGVGGEEMAHDLGEPSEGWKPDEGGPPEDGERLQGTDASHGVSLPDWSEAASKHWVTFLSDPEAAVEHAGDFFVSTLSTKYMRPSSLDSSDTAKHASSDRHDTDTSTTIQTDDPSPSDPQHDPITPPSSRPLMPPNNTQTHHHRQLSMPDTRVARACVWVTYAAASLVEAMGLLRCKQWPTMELLPRTADVALPTATTAAAEGNETSLLERICHTASPRELLQLIESKWDQATACRFSDAFFPAVAPHDGRTVVLRDPSRSKDVQVARKGADEVECARGRAAIAVNGMGWGEAARRLLVVGRHSEASRQEIYNTYSHYGAHGTDLATLHCLLQQDFANPPPLVAPQSNSPAAPSQSPSPDETQSDEKQADGNGAGGAVSAGDGVCGPVELAVRSYPAVVPWNVCLWTIGGGSRSHSAPMFPCASSITLRTSHAVGQLALASSSSLGCPSPPRPSFIQVPEQAIRNLASYLVRMLPLLWAHDDRSLAHQLTEWICRLALALAVPAIGPAEVQLHQHSCMGDVAVLRGAGGMDVCESEPEGGVLGFHIRSGLVELLLGEAEGIHGFVRLGYACGVVPELTKGGLPSSLLPFLLAALRSTPCASLTPSLLDATLTGIKHMLPTVPRLELADRLLQLASGDGGRRPRRSAYAVVGRRLLLDCVGGEERSCVLGRLVKGGWVDQLPLTVGMEIAVGMWEQTD
ncbi:unnamed protein product [Vitrella brassicaformis CCMP3155]|uniref:Uncharacterized protein n=2 Tax=Vitrella brassicaformis TaxID=1169539 RepID=A0A0G4G9Q7_VITBC|nr:unnamed protein product [Vitrella brassicaformis CCMP3155]|eukprot:CEM25752.1 unnamed protein product [Vitrella brassicaformis CCMP3155]